MTEEMRVKVDKIIRDAKGLGPDDVREVVLVMAGVDLSHQAEKCDWCGDAVNDDTRVRTCSHDGPKTLCLTCYRKAGSLVR